jgi:hypothetical protein
MLSFCTFGNRSTLVPLRITRTVRAFGIPQNTVSWSASSETRRACRRPRCHPHELKRRLVGAGAGRHLQLRDDLGGLGGHNPRGQIGTVGPLPRTEPTRTGPGRSDQTRCPQRCTRLLQITPLGSPARNSPSTLTPATARSSSTTTSLSLPQSNSLTIERESTIRSLEASRTDAPMMAPGPVNEPGRGAPPGVLDANESTSAFAWVDRVGGDGKPQFTRLTDAGESWRLSELLRTLCGRLLAGFRRKESRRWAV